MRAPHRPSPGRVRRAVEHVGSHLEDGFDCEGMWRVYSENELRLELISCTRGFGSSCLLYGGQRIPPQFRGVKSLLDERFGSSLGSFEEARSSPPTPDEFTSMAEAKAPSDQVYKRSTRWAIQLADLLSVTESPVDVRAELVRLIPGLGLVRASTFLRNVQYSYSLAILDAPTIRYCSMIGLREVSSSAPCTRRAYGEGEKAIAKYSKSTGIRPGILQTAVWVVLRLLDRLN